MFLPPDGHPGSNDPRRPGHRQRCLILLLFLKRNQKVEVVFIRTTSARGVDEEVLLLPRDRRRHLQRTGEDTGDHIVIGQVGSAAQASVGDNWV